MHGGVIKAFITHQRPPTMNPTHKSSRLSTTDWPSGWHALSHQTDEVLCRAYVQSVLSASRTYMKLVDQPMNIPHFVPLATLVPNVSPGLPSLPQLYRSRRLLFIMPWTRIIKRLLRSHKQDEWARRKRGTLHGLLSARSWAESIEHGQITRCFPSLYFSSNSITSLAGIFLFLFLRNELVQAERWWWWWWWWW